MDTQHSQCWIGLNTMAADAKPTGNRDGCNPPTCVDHCYAQGKPLGNVSVREEKFIAANDVVSTIITSSRPVTIEFSGHSFAGGNNPSRDVVSLKGSCAADASANAVVVTEGGTVKAKVAQSPDLLVDANLMLDGMSAAWRRLGRLAVRLR